MKRNLRKIMSVLIVLTLLLPLGGAVATDIEGVTRMEFGDVSPDDWFYPYVRFVYESDIMQGTDINKFSPNNTLTRAQVAAVLFRIHYGRASAESDLRDNDFTDVSESEWFAPYVAWASANGIVGGIGNNRFAPHGNVTRQEFATMLHRFAENFTSLNTDACQSEEWDIFTDRNQIADWAWHGMAWANFYGYMRGVTDRTIEPTGAVVRADVAAMLTRFVWHMRVTEVSADDFLLTISVKETTLPRGEDFVVNVRFENQSGRNIRMVLHWPSPAVPHVENWDGWQRTLPRLPPGHWWLNLNHGEYHEATWLLGGIGGHDTLSIALPSGTHELRFRAVINVDQETVEVWSNVVILTVQ